MASLGCGHHEVFVEANASRVRCWSRHGVTVAAVPWARHGAGHTRDFDDLAAVVSGADLEASGERSCCGWRGARSGAIVRRVNADHLDATVYRLDGLRRIGIDEISYKRGAQLPDGGGRP